jgi:AraC-like DNA-binding protein
MSHYQLRVAASLETLLEPSEGPVYREIDPPPDLAAFVECFWISEALADRCQRILPDGCIDLLFYSRGSQLLDARVVGAMTCFHDVSLRGGESILGVRFQPGMAGTCLPCDLPSLNDKTARLAEVAGQTTRVLFQHLARCSSIEARIEALGSRLVMRPKVTEVQQAIAQLVRNRGHLTVPDFACAAGLGDRQLRRACLRHSGLGPKQLSRILRFRHASKLLREGAANLAGVALDCGYYDQAHMIREFRLLGGTSPLRYLRQNGG